MTSFWRNRGVRRCERRRSGDHKICMTQWGQNDLVGGKLVNSSLAVCKFFTSPSRQIRSDVYNESIFKINALQFSGNPKTTERSRIIEIIDRRINRRIQSHAV